MALPSYTPPNATPIWAQANAQAQSIYQPILDQINAAYDRERQAAIQRQAQLAQATDAAYQSAHDPMEKLWSGAIEQGTTLENAVSNRLKGVGESRTADFASKLASINAPTGAGDLAKTYQGADASGFARGMNDVSRLVGRKAESLSWLEKQPGLARQQSGKDLQEALSEMYGKYQDNRGEVLSGVPGQTQDIFDKLYGRASDENQTKTANAWKQVEAIQAQIDHNNEMKIAAQSLGDKAAARRATAAGKALDRELAQWKAQLNADVDIRGQDVRAETSTANNIRSNQPKPGQGGLSPQQQRLREQQAKTDIRREILNPKSQQLRQAYAGYSEGQLNKVINGILESNQIPPFSKAGTAIRRSILKNAGKFGKKPSIPVNKR